MPGWQIALIVVGGIAGVVLVVFLLVFALAYLSTLACIEGCGAAVDKALEHDDDTYDTDDDYDDYDDDAHADDDDTYFDDDQDDDTETANLLLIGEDADGLASWLADDDAWTRRAIPPATLSALGHEFGPSFFVAGSAGWAVWNAYNGDNTAGQEWLRFDPQHGWLYDDYHRVTADDAAITSMYFASDYQDDLWVISRRVGADLDEYRLCGYLFGYPVQLLYLGGEYSLTAMVNLPDEDGLLAGSRGDEGFLQRYTDFLWAPAQMPAGYEDGFFTWFWLSDVYNGYAAWESTAGDRAVLEMQAAGWSALEPPVGCEGSVPNRFFGDGGYVLAFDDTAADDRFWELRDDVWTCREISGDAAGATLLHAQLWTNGRVFLAAQAADDETPFLFEVFADRLEPVTLPADLVRLRGMHSLGDAAPAQSLLLP